MLTEVVQVTKGSFPTVTTNEFNVHPRIHTFHQVVYRQNWQGRTTVLETNKTSVELQIPSGEDYLIEIKALTEGGHGTSSGPIRIPKMSSKFQILCSMQMIGVGIKQRGSGTGALGVTNPLCD